MFSINISNGYNSSFRGPFSHLTDAVSVFCAMPIGDDETAYLEQNDNVIGTRKIDEHGNNHITLSHPALLAKVEVDYLLGLPTDAALIDALAS